MAISVALTYEAGDLTAVWDSGSCEAAITYEYFVYKDDELYDSAFTGGLTFTLVDVPDGDYYVLVDAYVLDGFSPCDSGTSDTVIAGDQYLITIVRLPSSSAGTVSINGTPTSSSSQLADATVNVLVTPVPSFDFVNIEIDDVIVSTDPAYSFSMPASNIVLTANFEAKVIPPIPPLEQTSIYDTNCPKFYLATDFSDRFLTGEVIDLSLYTVTEVEEPQKFSDGKFKLERDPQYHGFNYEFSVDNLEYELGTLGYDYLKNSLYTTGTDSDVKFLYGFGQEDSFTVFYLGKVDFNEYKEIENGEVISFGVRELDFDNILQTAFEVEQSTAPDLDLLLYSKVIPKKVTYTVPQNDQTILQGNTLAYTFSNETTTLAFPITQYSAEQFYVFINDGREGDDLEIFATYDFQVDIVSPYATGGDPRYLFRAKQAGVYNVKVNTTLRLFLNQLVGGAIFSTNFNNARLDIAKADPEGVLIGSVTSYTGTVLNNFNADGFADIEFDEEFNFEMDLEQSVYIYLRVFGNSDIPDGSSIDLIGLAPYRGDSNQAQITVVAETLEKASLTKTIAPLPLLESVISQSAETGYTTVISDFFDDGGCGNKLSILNGFNVRSAELTDRTYIKTSAKNLIDGLKNLFCLGWGIEYNYARKETIRIEPVEYFYQDVEIISFDNVSDYSKEIDSSKYYNEIEVGFSNYSKDREKDKGNTIDDFHTKHLYQTPIKTNKNKVSMVTNLTLSGYEIEILRRKQFDKKGDDENANFKEDEDLFGVQLVDYTLFSGASYEGILSDLVEGNILRIDNNSIIVVGYAYFYNGQSITVNVDGQGDVTTSVLSIQYRYFNVSGFVDQILGTLINFTVEIDSIVNPAFSVTVVMSTIEGQSYLVPESNQSFSTTSNVISPQTCYNLRYTPKRVLYNHAKLFNGGFFGKSNTDLISFKQGDGNVELETQFSIGETCLLGDVDRELIIEDGNVMISDIYNRGYLHLPIKVSFSAPLSFEQLTDLKDCLRGRDDYRNYGYISIINPCGEAEQIYLTSVEYSGVEDEVKMEGYLKSL
jgi:hypothetical protein